MATQDERGDIQTLGALPHSCMEVAFRCFMPKHTAAMTETCQVFDRGTMRDGEGREVDFRNSVILMTSNLGSDRIMDLTADAPEISGAQLLDVIRPLLADHFQPALLARFQPIVYKPLTVDVLAEIVRMKLARIGERLQRQHGVSLTCPAALLSTLAQACLIRESGARNVDSLLNEKILPVVAREILSRMQTGDMPDETRLGLTEEGDLTIDFVAHRTSVDTIDAAAPSNT